MSDYSETLAASEGRNIGSLLAEIKTLGERLDATQKRAEGYRREDDDNRQKAERLWGENRRLKEQVADLQAAYQIAKVNQTEAQNRARALEYALQALVDHADGMHPALQVWVIESQALLGGTDAGPRLVVREFAAALEETLRRNEGKEDWLDADFSDLRYLLETEMRELEAEIYSCGAPELVQAEACDVAACAMFLWHKGGGSKAINRGREVVHGS